MRKWSFLLSKIGCKPKNDDIGHRFCGCEVKKMDEQKLCADCLNLSRAVYCMQCIRMNKGHNDMFRSSAPVTLPTKYDNKKTDFSQAEKR